MTAAEADFYDRDLENPDSRALKPLHESPWLDLYQEAARWVDNRPVIDLGSGTGRFAACLRENGHNGGYWGLDFSSLAVRAAQTQALEGFVLFEQRDLRTWTPPEILRSDVVFTCLETLEHLADDLDLVRRIPPGHRLILSVPNYGSAAHVRRFTGPGEVWGRYESLLVFRRWTYVDLAEGRPGRAIHLVETVRRSESW